MQRRHFLATSAGALLARAGWQRREASLLVPGVVMSGLTAWEAASPWLPPHARPLGASSLAAALLLGTAAWLLLLRFVQTLNAVELLNIDLDIADTALGQITLIKTKIAADRAGRQVDGLVHAGEFFDHAHRHLGRLWIDPVHRLTRLAHQARRGRYDPAHGGLRRQRQGQNVPGRPHTTTDDQQANTQPPGMAFHRRNDLGHEITSVLRAPRAQIRTT